MLEYVVFLDKKNHLIINIVDGGEKNLLRVPTFWDTNFVTSFVGEK